MGGGQEPANKRWLCRCLAHRCHDRMGVRRDHTPVRESVPLTPSPRTRAALLSRSQVSRISSRGARAMTRADNRGLAGIPSAVLGLFVAGNLLVVVNALLALIGAGVLEALARRRA